MTTHLALTQARHQQALADLADAEAELLAAMLAVEPGFTGGVDAMLDRRWESKLEGARPHWELGRAFGAYKRAHRAEAKARSAIHRAKFDTPSLTGHVVGSPAMTADEVLAGLRERRAAA